MKILSGLILSLIFFAGAAPLTDGPKKIALIIAIGNYDSSTGWKTISSINDINYLKPALINQGFMEQNIEILKNEAATKEGILAAINRLIQKAGLGDIVVFHFSGHGQQIFDDGKKDEADGYDEALVPYNAKMRYSGGYTGQNHLRDDELGEKLKELRKKIGNTGSLLVLLDACHSGTATRGQEFAITRGTDERCEPEGYSKTIHTSRGASNETVFDDKELLSNMVVISAASADQLNYETKDDNKNGVGALSYAFCRAISQASGGINYKILFEKIRTDIQSWKPFQNPQIEGNTEQEVLGGKYVPTSDIIRISSWNADNSIDIPRGNLHGITKGIQFSLYPVELTDFKNAKPVAGGEITETGMVKSKGIFTGPLPQKNKAYNIVIENKSYGEMNVAVKLALGNAAISSLIRKKLEQYEYVLLDKPNADISITSYKTAAGPEELLQVVATNDSVLWQKPWSANANQLSAEEIESIWQTIKQYSRAQFLRSVYTPADSKVFEYVQVDFIPGIVRSINGTDSLVLKKSLQQITNSRGDIEFIESDDSKEENEGFVIRIRNLHDYPVYLSVIDIMPNNAIDVVIPDPLDLNSTAEDFKIGARQMFTTRPIKLYPPYGKDFMKILITKIPMDLRAIQSRTTSRGTGSSFERFYNETFKDENSENSSVSRVAPVKVDEIKIVPFTYNITRKK